ncbi:hypothetical protein C8R45DRAFT_1101219 [Mycena sanguinolenta]|nr:hypothetical protein C8R45DRAFT_1101219 [Mycena sanguinolenta]
MGKRQEKGKKLVKDDAIADAPCKKCGTPSQFQGARLEFITARVPDYLRHSKNKTLDDFWSDLTHDYWWRFPWRIPLNEEVPEPPEEEVPADAEAAFRALHLDLLSEEAAEKSKIQKETKKKIKAWYNRQRPGKMKMQQNPYFEYLARVRDSEKRSPPKRVPDYQFYIQHPDFKEQVAQHFEELHQDAPRNKHISLRCEVARDMLAAEPEDVKARLKEENTKAYDTEVAEYEEDDDDDEADPDEAVKEKCRKEFLPIVAPLLTVLRKYTGYMINIVAARVNGSSFDVVSANAGTVDGKDWAKWDPTGYGEMLPKFLKFVHALDQGEGSGEGTQGPLPCAPPPPQHDGAAPSGLAAIAQDMLTMTDNVEMSDPVPDTAGDSEMGPPPPPLSPRTMMIG